MFLWPIVDIGSRGIYSGQSEKFYLKIYPHLEEKISFVNIIAGFRQSRNNNEELVLVSLEVGTFSKSA